MATSILIIIFVIIFINIIRAAQKGTAHSGPRTNRRMWAETAYEQNLEIFPPDGTNPFPSMRGMTDGLYVEVWGDFDTSGRALLFCRVEYALSLPFRLCIVKGPMEKESAGASYEIRGFSSSEISVAASDGAELQKFLTPQNLNILKNCTGIYHAVKVTDTFLVLAATDINDAVTLNAFLERAVSAAKSLTGGHTVSMDPTERKPLKPVSDSAELILPEKKKAEPLPRHFAPVVPAEELLPEIVEQKSEIPAEPMIEKPLVPSVEIPAEPIIETPVVPAVEIPAEPMIETEMDLTEEGVCSALFSAAFPGENEKAFFQKITGKTVHWKGTLKSVYPYSSDFVFGKGPGTKATFEIAEVASGYGMKNKIKATVSFSADTIAQLKGNSGKTFSFSGTLLKFEPFAREILVEKGTLES